MRTLSVDGGNIIVVGDGRSEIEAGVAMGALTLSRLDKASAEQRKMHFDFGSNIMLEDYTDPGLYALLIPSGKQNTT
jgi:hypothetical protein